MLIQALTFCFTPWAYADRRQTPSSRFRAVKRRLTHRPIFIMVRAFLFLRPVFRPFLRPMHDFPQLLLKIFSGGNPAARPCVYLQIHDIFGQFLTPSELHLFIQPEINIAVTRAFGLC